MMGAQCLITGVILIEDDVTYAGDLFEMGGMYIVNCNEASGGARMVVAGDKTITPTGDYWTRKGVYVIPVEDARLSIAALEYIGK